MNTIDAKFELVKTKITDSELERIRSLIKMLDEQTGATNTFALQSILTAHDVGSELKTLKESLGVIQPEFDIFAESAFGLAPQRTVRLMQLAALSRDRLESGCGKEFRLAYHQLELVPQKEQIAEGARGRNISLIQAHGHFVNAFAKFKRRLEQGHIKLGNMAIIKRDARPLFDWLKALYGEHSTGRDTSTGRFVKQ
jgi:hypothetical protein